MTGRTSLRIGNCSGFFGDRGSAALEMVESAEIDVLVGDWLAELTMTILQKQQQRDPLKGYASTFLRQLETVLGTCLDRSIKVVSNAGGLNPAGCAAAVTSMAERLGLTPTVGHVEGDDILGRLDEFTGRGELLSLYDGQPLSLDGDQPLVANAYLGGWGIASALSQGADVVVTGRVTDASLVVGPAAWAFDWQADSWNELAGAVVAGHVIECGAQATGGNFAFFEEIPGYERLGFPIAEIRPDGSSVITKPTGTGGAVTRDTVSAQLLYEVQSTRYANPDVTTHLDSIELVDEGPDRVLITGVTGEAPTDKLKVSLAVAGGFRNSMTLVISGLEPEAKAEVAERAIWNMVPGGKAAFDEVDVELIGRPAEDPADFASACSLLRIAVSGADERLVGRTFSSAVVETGLASYPGFFMTTPPTPASAFATYRPALVPAIRVPAQVVVTGPDGVWQESVQNTGVTHGVAPNPNAASTGGPTEAPADLAAGPTRRVALGTLLGARSGDKGGDANLGVWARDDAIYAWMSEALSTEVIRTLVPESRDLEIRRYALPRLRAVNFVIHGLLGDGVSSCLRLDGQAKGLGEYFRSRHLDVPVHLLEGARNER